MHNRRSYLKHLSEAEYPASTQQILAVADCNNAPAGILDILEKLPDVDFQSEEEVAEACLMVEKMAKEKHE